MRRVAKTAMVPEWVGSRAAFPSGHDAVDRRAVADGEFHHVAVLQVGDPLVRIVILVAARIGTRDERAIRFDGQRSLEDKPLVLEIIEPFQRLAAVDEKDRGCSCARRGFGARLWVRLFWAAGARVCRWRRQRLL